MSIDWTPARRISPKSQGNRGFITTSKSPISVVEYESCIERDLLLLAIHDPAVIGIRYQPNTIFYTDSTGKQRKYTPDIYLEFKDGKQLLIEIKPSEEVYNNSKNFEERWAAAREWADPRGIKFLVVTDSQIKTSRWMNVWFTLGPSRCNENVKYMKKLNHIISNEGEEYNYLCKKVSDEFAIDIGKAAQIICYAIYHGFVFVDTFSTNPLTNATIIKRLDKNRTVIFSPLWTEILEEGETFDDFNSELNRNEEKVCSPTLESGKEDESFIKRKKMVEEWLNQPVKTDVWRESYFYTWGLQKSQIYRYIKRYLEEGEKGLLSRRENAGRSKKYVGKLKDLVEESRRVYLKPNGTLRLAYAKLEELCTKESISIPTFHAFKGYVRYNTTSIEKAQKRGQDVVKSQFNPSLRSFQDGIMPLQVIQMDNTRLDIFPVDESIRESLATPYLTAAIDCFTGLITGFSVSFYPSSAQTIINVLTQTILSKDEYCKEYETQHEW